MNVLLERRNNMKECFKCGCLNPTMIYHDGLHSYYLKGSNRKLRKGSTIEVASQPLIEFDEEHLEYLCTRCGYGWIDKIDVVIEYKSHKS
jgi:hypothetical protein